MFPGGVFFRGGYFFGGVFSGGGCSPPEYGQRSAGTHPTGMLLFVKLLYSVADSTFPRRGVPTQSVFANDALSLDPQMASKTVFEVNNEDVLCVVQSCPKSHNYRPEGRRFSFQSELIAS